MRWAPLAVVALGCVAENPVRLPDSESASSIIAVLEAGDERPLLYATRRQGLQLPILTRDARLFLFDYDEPLDQLALTEGLLLPPGEGDEARLIPVTDQKYVWDASGGEWGQEELPAEVLGATFAGLNFLNCADAGGCFIQRSSEEPPACLEPCVGRAQPDFSVALPEVPFDIILEPWCPQAWLDDGRCTPAPGDADFLDELRAGQLPGCSGDWPQGLSGSVVYVRAGAMGGNGTMQSPYGDLATGIAAASEGEIIALHAGDYQADINASVSIVGAGSCGTSLQGRVEATGVRVELSGLQLMSTTDRGISVDGGRVVLDRVAIIGAGEEAILVSNEGTVEGSDVLIEGAGGQDKGWTIALSAVNGTVAIDRLAMTGVQTALWATGQSAVQLSNVYADGLAQGVLMNGLQPEDAPEVVLQRVVFQTEDEAASVEAGALHVTEGIFHRTAGGAGGAGAIDRQKPTVYAKSNAELTLRRAHLSGQLSLRIWIDDGATGTLEGVVIDASEDDTFINEVVAVRTTTDTDTILRDFRIHRFNARGLWSQVASVELERVRIDSGDCSLAPQPVSTFPVTISGDGVAQNKKVMIKDLVLRGHPACPARFGLTIRQMRGIEVYRVLIENVALGARFGAPNSSVRTEGVVKDLVVQNIFANTNVKMIGVEFQEADIMGQRWRIEVSADPLGGGFRAIRTDDDNGANNAELFDLHIYGDRTRPLLELDEAVGIAFRAGGSLRLERALIDAPLGLGLDVLPSVFQGEIPSFTGNNILLIAKGADELFGGREPPSVGARFSRIPGEFKNFQIVGWGTGARVAGPMTPDFLQGAFTGNTFGLVFRDLDHPRSYLELVFEDNVENVRVEN